MHIDVIDHTAQLHSPLPPGHCSGRTNNCCHLRLTHVLSSEAESRKRVRRWQQLLALPEQCVQLVAGQQWEVQLVRGSWVVPEQVRQKLSTLM
jgi:hypothetical protein